jgi:ketosteroid isomerase-like protein/CheY-like chemotaxis protein
MPEATLRILHCDDSEAYRRLLELVLGSREDLEVVASVAEHAVAVEEAQRLQPDVVLLDARVPGGTDHTVTALRAVAPAAAVVVLSALEDPDHVLRRAADGFVAKSSSFDDIAVALRAIARTPSGAPVAAYGRGAGADAAIATVRRIYDAFARRDIEEALAFADPAFELMPHGTASRLGRSDPYRGHDGIRQYFADAEQVWEELRIAAEDFRATAGGVVVFGSVEGVSEGRRLRRKAVWVWQVRDGLATSMRVTDIGDVVSAS